MHSSASPNVVGSGPTQLRLKLRSISLARHNATDVTLIRMACSSRGVYIDDICHTASRSSTLFTPLRLSIIFLCGSSSLDNCQMLMRKRRACILIALCAARCIRSPSAISPLSAFLRCMSTALGLPLYSLVEHCKFYNSFVCHALVFIKNPGAKVIQRSPSPHEKITNFVSGVSRS